MRTKRSVWVCAATWGIVLGCLAHGGRGLAVQVKGVLLAPVKIGPKEPTVDAILIQATTEAGACLVCDTTALDHDLVLTGMERAMLGDALLAVVRAKRLAITQTDEQAFALWSLPDLPPLMLQAKGGARPERLEPKTPPDERNAVLRKWMEATLGTGKAPVDVPMGDLPEEVRSVVIADAQGWVAHLVGSGGGQAPDVFNPEFWARARVWVEEDTDQGRRIQMFRFGVRDKEVKWSREMGWQM